MRITGGAACGRKIAGPGKQENIRPTSDRVREAIFSIIADRVSGAVVLDLFAGTGAFGLEALSRGAGSVVFVDNARNALELIGLNLKSCFDNPQARLFQLDLTKEASVRRLRESLPATYRSNLVFIDPPYEKNLAENLLGMVEISEILSTDGLVIVEERQHQRLPEKIDRLQVYDRRRYGETGLWFYSYTS